MGVYPFITGKNSALIKMAAVYSQNGSRVPPKFQVRHQNLFSSTSMETLPGKQTKELWTFKIGRFLQKLWEIKCFPLLTTWRSGYCDLNKGECDLNQSKDDSFVKQVAKNNNWNNGDRHKIHEIFLTNCFVFVVILVWQTVHSSAMTQFTADLMEKTLQLTVPG